jgi:hypothetical protein
MKINGKCLVGDSVSLDSYTADWMSVRVEPTVYYRRMDEFHKSLATSKGLYTYIDMGQHVVIRFSEKADVTAFYRKHNEYI